jgi:hypothetical protein
MDSKLTVKNALDIIKRINFENLIFSKINKGSRGQLVEKLLGLKPAL